jgi:hypothetical protein
MLVKCWNTGAQFVLGLANETDMSIAEFIEAHDVDVAPETLKKYQRFTQTFTGRDLDRLCELRRPNGRALHFGHVHHGEKDARRPVEVSPH